MLHGVLVHLRTVSLNRIPQAQSKLMLDCGGPGSVNGWHHTAIDGFTIFRSKVHKHTSGNNLKTRKDGDRQRDPVTKSLLHQSSWASERCKPSSRRPTSTVVTGRCSRFFAFSNIIQHHPTISNYIFSISDAIPGFFLSRFWPPLACEIVAEASHSPHVGCCATRLHQPPGARWSRSPALETAP